MLNLNLFKMVMTPPTDSFIFLYQMCLKFHINFNFYWIYMILLIFESTQLIFTLKIINNDKYITKDMQIANLGGNRLVQF